MLLTGLGEKVSSFNTRVGAVTLAKTDVTNALGFTPDGSPSIGGTTFADFTMNQATPNGRVEFSGTNPMGWNVGAGRKTVDFEFVSNNYFLHNPDGHVAIVTRCNMALIATQVSGQGAIMGNLAGNFFEGDGALFTPTTIIETWDTTGTAGQRFLFPKTTGPRNALLLDGQRYRWIIETTKANSGEKYIRYRLYKYAGATKKGWDLLVDTGDVLDHNAGADLTKDGLTFGHVLGNNFGTWSINFSNVKVTWAEPGVIATDNQAQVSSLGSDLSGDLNFTNVGRLIRAPSNAGPSLANSVSFQSSTPNTATTFVVKPNGSASVANFLFSNNSSSATSYGAVTVGMSGSRAGIQTFGFNTADPVLDVIVGVGTTPTATFTPTGIVLVGAPSPIGKIATTISGLNSYGGGSAVQFCQSAMNVETFCTVGQIASFMSPAPTNVQIENIIRPAYCMISCLLAEIISTRVIRQ